MFRQSLFVLSESDTARRLVTGVPIARHLAQRFVAGETLDEAIAAARSCNQHGLSASLDYLGESVTRRQDVEDAVQMARRIVTRIAAEEIDANISIKPTQLGLGIGTDLCRESVSRVLDRAREVGNGAGEIFVRLDMESAEYTERTVALVEALWARGYRNVGTVLQSCLYRTPNDLRRLMDLGSRVRLVKGAYREPSTVAYPDKGDVDRRYVEQTQLLLREGTFPAIATHDEEIINATRRYAFEHGVAKESFEFQMLYGIRRDLQHRLREEGYRVRVYIPFGEQWYPYLMRRMAERPANLVFVTGSVLKESPLRWVAKPMAIGAGAVAGVIGALGARALWGRK
jgi:proline dehydrogenase